MLARLMRWMLLAESALGAALGYWLVSSNDWSLWTVPLLAALLPFAAVLPGHLAATLLSRARNEPAALWWRALAGETWAAILVFVLRQPWSRHAPTLSGERGNPARVAVLLVHGYMCNHRIWDEMAAVLRRQGHTVLAIDLEPVFAPIDDYAPLIEAAVQALCAHTGQAQVALVGHSMGGLAIRAWMRAHGTERVARVLTLGTPHVGTKLAQASSTPNGRQMRWHSTWLAELATSEAAQSYRLIHVALTPQDNIVFPQRAQVLDGVTPTVFEGLGHVQLALDPGVAQWVQDHLADITPTP